MSFGFEPNQVDLFFFFWHFHFCCEMIWISSSDPFPPVLATPHLQVRQTLINQLQGGWGVLAEGQVDSYRWKWGARPPQGADSYLWISRTLEGAKIAWALFTPEWASSRGGGVRVQSNCFPQKGCTGWLDREDLYSMAEGNEEGGLVAQYGKVVGVVRDLLWR